MTDVRCAAALSTEPESGKAVAQVCDEALAQLGGAPDLAFFFVSHHHGPHFSTLAPALCDRLATETLLGCTGESIVGGGREIEDGPALSLWLAKLPGTRSWPMRLMFERTPEGGVILGWPDDLPAIWPPDAALLLLGEPFSFPADLLLERANEDHPGVPVAGGMASGAQRPGENRVFCGRQEFNSGAVAVLLHGRLRVTAVVSQGCRPIGRHFVITKAERNVIQQLGGKPPLAQLQETFAGLSTEEQALAQQGIHVGRVVNECQDQFARGDFLVRNVTGADPDSGAISIGDFVRPGQTVQFHVRDARTADEDLRELLAGAAARGASPQGALLFTCNGRGTRLFDEPHHDAGALAKQFGELPAAGFFAQGEIGPIGGKNFLHGFTASVVLFG